MSQHDGDRRYLLNKANRGQDISSSDQILQGVKRRARQGVKEDQAILEQIAGKIR